MYSLSTICPTLNSIIDGIGSPESAAAAAAPPDAALLLSPFFPAGAPAAAGSFLVFSFLSFFPAAGASVDSIGSSVAATVADAFCFLDEVGAAVSDVAGAAAVSSFFFFFTGASTFRSCFGALEMSKLTSAGAVEHDRTEGSFCM